MWGYEAQEGVVEEYLRADIQEVDARERYFEDEDRSHGIEDDLEGAEEGLAKDGVEEEGFKGGGEIGIEPVNAEGFVVREVVWLADISFAILPVRQAIEHVL